MKGEIKMRRVQAACLNQTLHFLLKDDIEHDEAVAQVEVEVKEYKEYLLKKQIPHKILEEIRKEDGTVILKVKKQVNGYDVGEYLE